MSYGTEELRSVLHHSHSLLQMYWESASADEDTVKNQKTELLPSWMATSQKNIFNASKTGTF
jgi:hypothetical protein